MEFPHYGNNHKHYLDDGHDVHRHDNDDDTGRNRDDVDAMDHSRDDDGAMGHYRGGDDTDHSHDDDYDDYSSRLPHLIHNQRCRTIGHT